MDGAEAFPVYLNGAYLSSDKACVSVMDRGFLFGDAVYEVVPVYGGRVFRLEQHLVRLQRSLKATGIPNPCSPRRWEEILSELARRAGGGDLGLYLHVTRGVSERRDHAFPADVEPTVFVMASPLPRPVAGWLRDGVRAVLLEDLRWSRCDIKGTSLLGNVLLRQQAVEQGAVEAILVRDGMISEGAATNVFLVVEGVIETPPNSDELLPGITRDLILELARDNGLPCTVRPISRDRLLAADEIWITSSSKEVLAVTEMDGRPVGEGRPGPVWTVMHDLFQRYKELQREGVALA